MEKKFKKGDWVFADFRLMMIENEIRPDYYSVRDWALSTSSGNCYPITLNTQAATDHIKSLYNQLHTMGGSLNWPDLSREFVRLWVELIDLIEKGETENPYENSTDFFRTIRDQVKATSLKHINGINIFR